MAANRSSTSAHVRPKSASVYRCPRPVASAALLACAAAAAGLACAAAAAGLACAAAAAGLACAAAAAGSERIASAAAPDSGSPKCPYAAATVPNGSATKSSYRTS
jgi:hypothetical protein